MAAEKTCPVCGNVFERPVGVSKATWAARQYCSSACGSRIPRLGRYKDVPLVKTCENCGVTFEKPEKVRLGSWSRRRFCTVSCAKQFRGREQRENRPERICPICKQPFKSRHPAKFAATCGSIECKRRYKREVAGVLLSERMKADYASGRRKPGRGTSPREEALWPLLRKHGWQLRLRWFDDWGSFELDFALPQRKLNVEIDGPEHGWGTRKPADEARDAELRSRGWTIIRIPNAEVDADPAAVAARILAL